MDRLSSVYHSWRKCEIRHISSMWEFGLGYDVGGGGVLLIFVLSEDDIQFLFRKRDKMTNHHLQLKQIRIQTSSKVISQTNCDSFRGRIITG